MGDHTLSLEEWLGVHQRGEEGEGSLGRGNGRCKRLRVRQGPAGIYCDLGRRGFVLEEGWAVSLKGLDCRAKKLENHCWVIYCKQGGDTFRCAFYKAQCLCGGDTGIFCKGPSVTCQGRRQDSSSENTEEGAIH